MPTDTKRCVTCGQTKPVGEFYPNPGGMPGYRSHCKPCWKDRRRAAYERAGGSAVPHAQLLKREYGLTPDDYEALLRRQAYRCSVCRRPETKLRRDGKPYRLSVDHDHVTGKVRGLLCHRCNLVVWALEENHLSLAGIAAYIDQFRASLATP